MQTVRFNRKNLFARDQHTCQYCGRNEPSHKLSLDHVIPRERGGRTSWTNCVLACIRCNVRKGSRLLDEARTLVRLDAVPSTEVLKGPALRARRRRSRISW